MVRDSWSGGNVKSAGCRGPYQAFLMLISSAIERNWPNVDFGMQLSR